MYQSSELGGCTVGEAKQQGRKATTNYGKDAQAGF